MSLAEELETTLLQALGRRAELRRRMAEELERKREELRDEEGLTEVPDDLTAHANELKEEIARLEGEIGLLRSTRERQSQELDRILSGLSGHLERLCERQAQIRQRQTLARDFLGAMEAFITELTELRVLDSEATPAQKASWLKLLMPGAAGQVQAELSALAVEVSHTLSRDEERRQRRRDLEKEQEQLEAEEEKIHGDLQAHAPGEELPTLALSIAEADGKILFSLRRHVLEVLLRDLRAEREGGLAPKMDPLLGLTREMGSTYPNP